MVAEAVQSEVTGGEAVLSKQYEIWEEVFKCLSFWFMIEVRSGQV